MAKSVPNADAHNDDDRQEAAVDENLLDEEDGQKETGTSDGQLEEDENMGVPTDRGWSWVIVICVFLNSFVILGHRRSLQALFVDITEEFHESTTVVSLTFTFYNLVSSFSTLFTTNILLSRFHARNICVVVAFFNALLTMSLFWAPNIVVWLIIYGLKGIPFGALLVVPVSMIGHYFKKRRGLASSIASTGLVVANITFPPLSAYLRIEFGFRWTMLLLGAIELHAIAPLLLLRPHSWYKKIYKRKHARLLEDLQAKSRTIYLGTDVDTSKPSSDQHFPALNKSPFSKRKLNTKENNLEGHDDSLQRQKTLSASSGSIIGTSLPGSTLDIVPVGVHPSAEEEGEEQLNSGPNEKRAKKKCSVSTFVDTSLLKLWTCRMMMSYMSFGAFANFAIAYMPTIAFHAGIGKADAALLLTIAGCMDLVVRIIVGYVADKGVISKEKMAAGSLMVIVIITQFARYYTTFNLFIMYAMVAGVFAGFRQNLFNSLCLDYFGADKAPKALGLCAMCITFLMSLNHPVVGALADATGSFTASLHYVGAVVFLSVIIISCAPIFKRWDEENAKKKNDASGNDDQIMTVIVDEPNKEK